MEKEVMEKAEKALEDMDFHLNQISAAMDDIAIGTVGGLEGRSLGPACRLIRSVKEGRESVEELRKEFKKTLVKI